MIYEIGKMYSIPCIKASATTPPSPARPGEWLPILLPWHEDVAIIKFPHWHYHLDFRFLSKRQMEASGFGVVVHRFAAGREEIEFFDGVVTYKRRKCQREMPSAYPDVKWRVELIAAYRDSFLINGKCPHKGLDLSGCPARAGIITCPGHGLRFDAATGKVVS